MTGNEPGAGSVDTRVRTPDLIREKVALLVAMSPTPIGRTALLDALSRSPEPESEPGTFKRILGSARNLVEKAFPGMRARRLDIKQHEAAGREVALKTILDELVREGTILQQDNGSKAYAAKDPWADIAYATIPEFSGTDRSVQLILHNVPEDSPVSAVMSRTQIEKNGLKAGDDILCRLSRGDEGFQLRALYLQHRNPERPSRISGHFNRRAAGDEFTAGNPHIKTTFRLLADPAAHADMDHRKVCYVDIPHDFDPRSPAVSLADDQDRDADTGRSIDDILIEKHRLDRVWSDEAMDEARRIAENDFHREGRTFVTGITIDPPGAYELDDMIFAERVPQDQTPDSPPAEHWITRVAIPDLASILPAGGSVDREARERGMTFYLKNKAVGMLPRMIGEEYGSLVYDVERPAICVEIEYDEHLNPVRESIFPAIARSTAACTYDEFADKIASGDPAIADLRDFNDRLYEKAQQNRSAPPARSSYSDFVGKTLVETFMVRANAVVAKYLSEHGAVFPYRKHAVNSNSEIYAKAREQIEKLGVAMPESPEDCSWDVLQDVLVDARAKGVEAAVKMRIDDITDRAYYTTKDLGHISLKLPKYAHFTSPLRRYPDILVQRAFYREYAKLHPAFARFAQTDEEREHMDQTIQHVNDMRDRERDVASDMEKYHLFRDLKAQEGNTMRAILEYVNGSSVEIILPQLGLRRRIVVDELPPDICRLDPETHALVFQADGRSLTKGAALRGRIEEVEPAKARWTFRIAEPA